MFYPLTQNRVKSNISIWMKWLNCNLWGVEASTDQINSTKSRGCLTEDHVMMPNTRVFGFDVRVSIGLHPSGTVAMPLVEGSISCSEMLETKGSFWIDNTADGRLLGLVMSEHQEWWTLVSKLSICPGVVGLQHWQGVPLFAGLSSKLISALDGTSCHRYTAWQPVFCA